MIFDAVVNLINNELNKLFPFVHDFPPFFDRSVGYYSADIFFSLDISCAAFCFMAVSFLKTYYNTERFLFPPDFLIKRAKKKAAANATAFRFVINLRKLCKVLNGANHLAGVAVFVVIPRNNLNLIKSVAEVDNHGLSCVKE